MNNTQTDKCQDCPWYGKGCRFGRGPEQDAAMRISCGTSDSCGTVSSCGSVSSGSSCGSSIETCY